MFSQVIHVCLLPVYMVHVPVMLMVDMNVTVSLATLVRTVMHVSPFVNS